MGNENPGQPRGTAIGMALARVVREGWCCVECGGAFCNHVNPKRCPSCNPPSTYIPAREHEEDEDLPAPRSGAVYR